MQQVYTCRHYTSTSKGYFKKPSPLFKSQSSTLQQRSIKTISADSIDNFSIDNESLLLLWFVSRDAGVKAQGVISDAKSFCDQNSDNSAHAKQDAEHGCSYEGNTVGSRAFSLLHGSTFVNDEIVTALRAMCNTRNAWLVLEGKLKHRSFIVGAFFAMKMLGLYIPPQASSGQQHGAVLPQMLGMKDTEIPFSSSLCSECCNDLHSWPLEHPDISVEYYSDSDPIIGKTLEIDTSADCVITKIEDKPIKDLDAATLRTICTSLSLPTSGERASVLYQLMR
eukprot:15359098-Ditylum_brightwellii.AAC.1